MSTAVAEAIPEKLVTHHDVARMFGVQLQTIRVWEKQGRLPPARRIGRTRYWTPEAIARFVGGEEDGAERGSIRDQGAHPEIRRCEAEGATS